MTKHLLTDDILLISIQKERGILTFRQAVYQLVCLIPEGKVLGYGQVAGLIGSPRAARQVGFALGALPVERAQPNATNAVPWWRVIRTSGQLALRGDQLRPIEQEWLLKEEGVCVMNNRVDMSTYGWLPGIKGADRL